MASLVSHIMVLASGITIQIGNHAWSFSSSFIVYLILAAIIGVLAEFLVGWRLPFGIVGAVIAGVIGAWLMTQVIVISGFGDINVDGVPLIRAFIGAVVLIAIWHAITYRSWSGRSRRYSYRG